MLKLIITGYCLIGLGLGLFTGTYWAAQANAYDVGRLVGS